jgi:chromosome segregation ATPase
VKSGQPYAAAAQDTWREKLEAESARREGAEGELREFQASQRAERDSWESKAVADMEVRRRAMEEERQSIIALEQKLQALQETGRSVTTEREGLTSKLEESEAALARAEAKMARMARDLAEAEEELEERDKVEETHSSTRGEGCTS